jgi:hypothetical protein
MYTTISLSVVSYGCETWSLTLKEEQRLRMFENRVLRRTFGPPRKEVAGGWRRLHNEKLHNLNASKNIIRVIKSMRMRSERHVACTGKMINAYVVLVEKPDDNRPRRRSRRRREKNHRRELWEI